MCENKYLVLDCGIITAREMTLETALMVACALAEKYWRDPCVEITIRKEPSVQCEQSGKEQAR